MKRKRTARNKRGQARSLGSLFQQLLPQDFHSRSARISQLQHFFADLESTDAVFAMVKVVNVSEQHLHLSLPNATLGAYLRLHSAQIRQMLLEQFNLDVELKISTRPQSAEPVQAEPRRPVAVSAETSKQLEKAADTIEDADLQAALKSLSRTLKRKNQT